MRMNSLLSFADPLDIERAARRITSLPLYGFINNIYTYKALFGYMCIHFNRHMLDET
jgi:hypothetical protein